MAEMSAIFSKMTCMAEEAELVDSVTILLSSWFAESGLQFLKTHNLKQTETFYLKKNCKVVKVMSKKE
jgi:hypothetical protein